VDRILGDVSVGAAGEFEARLSSRGAGDSATGGVPSPEQAMPAQEWLYGDAGDEPPVEAVVRIDAVLAAKAVADAGSSATVAWEADGSVTLTMPVRDVPNFREWVLGLLDHALILGPPALRDDIVTWLRTMATGATGATV
jgi:predicted DNA-binding transcriptional regulator YafY